MAEVSDIELLDAAEEHSAGLFKELCEAMDDRMLFLCLRVIVPVAQRRGLVVWFAESESIQ